VRGLPDLMDRIDQMGLTEEYLCFRQRYLGWRQGDTQGAFGELTSNQLREQNKKGGWGFWYPTVQEWQWRRTLSYWIAVTFLEGSLFFTISSFLWCYPERLGRLEATVTTWGYVAGKVNFFVCTYLMCLETINLSNADRADRAHDETSSESGEEEEGERVSVGTRARTGSSGIRLGGAELGKPEDRWRWWPFHVQTAVGKLHALGAGPWPYFASAIYLVGVLTFTVGLAAEFSPLPKEIARQVNLALFVLGSIFFAMGGVFECIENKVFTSLSMRRLLRCSVIELGKGYWGALLNLAGGLGFLTGAVLAYVPGLSVACMAAYGLGSALYALCGAVMIVMWKDEQFGLTFLAVLNQLGGPNGRPMLSTKAGQSEEAGLSLMTASFIIVYILLATVSVYDAMISAQDLWQTQHPQVVLMRTWNRFVPCLFAHCMLALNSGVYRTPKVAPFHLLYIGCRYLGVAMTVNSTAQFLYFLRHAEGHPVFIES